MLVCKHHQCQTIWKIMTPLKFYLFQQKQSMVQNRMGHNLSNHPITESLGFPVPKSICTRCLITVVLHSKDFQPCLLGPVTESRHMVVCAYHIKNFPDLGCPYEKLTQLQKQGALIEHPKYLHAAEATPSSTPLGRIAERNACLNIEVCNRVGIIQEECLLVGRYLFRVLERWEFSNGWKGSCRRWRLQRRRREGGKVGVGGSQKGYG